jgi:DNA-binding transcriptional regulator YiaG
MASAVGAGRRIIANNDQSIFFSCNPTKCRILLIMITINQYLETEKDGAVVPYSMGIRGIRERMNLDRVQFAESLGVSPRTVEAWEYDQRRPGIMVLVLLKKLMERGK